MVEQNVLPCGLACMLGLCLKGRARVFEYLNSYLNDANLGEQHIPGQRSQIFPLSRHLCIDLLVMQ